MRYRLDANRSRFTAQAFARGVLAVFGHNPTFAINRFDGEVEFDVADPRTFATLRMTVEVGSLTVIDQMRESDRSEIERTMREEVLEIARYPQIVFESRSVTARQIAEAQYRARIIGNLSLHGVTRQCEIEAAVTLSGRELRGQGAFVVRQTDYRIRPVSIAGGVLKLKDDVTLSFDLVASEKREHVTVRRDDAHEKA